MDGSPVSLIVRMNDPLGPLGFAGASGIPLDAANRNSHEPSPDCAQSQ